VGVQSSAFPAMQRSFAGGHLVSGSSGSTIADGIAISKPGKHPYEIIRRHVDDIVLVDEESIASAVMSLMEWDHMLAEGAGAAPVAALLQLDDRRLAAVKGRSVACVVSGGNIDVNLLRRIIPNGLKHSGRLFRIAVRIQDRPGRLAELLNLVGQAGANLLEVQHNRLSGTLSYQDVDVQLDLETLDAGHQQAILDALGRARFRVTRLD
ncbi:MAG TPA: pyridoxal-phosphate dependent enzyme, partial [Burkholderiales bacterium]|nr:pyridoxal-phosphate dependent enzyme [Burkholderiales bacterium]